MSEKNVSPTFRKRLGDVWRALKEGGSSMDAGRNTKGELDPSDNAKKARKRNLILAFIFLVSITYWWSNAQETARLEIPYSEFLRYVDQQKLKEVVITDQLISGTLLPESVAAAPKPFITVPLWDNDLAQVLEKNGVKYSVRVGGNWLSTFLLSWVLPMVFLFFLWGWMARRFAGGGGAGGFLSIGKNRARIRPESLPKVTFNEVAGVDEAKQELMETIQFLQNPTGIQRLGGRMPKGVLLVGLPGTGKTLLARAVAGEAGVPFFNISGSEFIEMFVGLGASRVRDLFDQARQQAPCIIFIDELDAIGRSRGGPVAMGGHNESEQTLNQLLTEMDGFDPSVGVVVMAATNRPEILDKALLRSGRFDRQILVDKPGLEGRLAILGIHTANITLGPDVDLRVVAQRTPGFVGADLANIANEAAIIAVRDNQESVGMKQFEAAIDRVLTGPEKKSRLLNEDEKRRVAYHEAGHALVAELVPTGEPIHKVSIIPRGAAALGFTLQLPVEEKFLSTEPELKDQIAILLGGRSAEDIVFGCVSTGAQNDLERASEIARAMICQLGMSKKLGPLSYGRRQRLAYLGIEGAEERNFSEESARLIDLEVRELVEDGQRRAVTLLTYHRHALDRIAELLEEKEVISGQDIKRVIEALASSD